MRNKKKIFTTVGAVGFAFSTVCMLSACGGITQPEQKEMHQILLETQSADYSGSWTINRESTSTYNENGEKSTSNSKKSVTFNNDTKEFFSYSERDGVINSYDAVKKLGSDTYGKYNLSNAGSTPTAFIVDVEYANSKGMDFLDYFDLRIQENYEEFANYYKNLEDDYKERYSSNGYSYDEINITVNYKKTGKNEYQLVQDFALDITSPVEDGEKSRDVLKQKIVYVYDDSSIKSYEMYYEESEKVFNASTNEIIEFEEAIDSLKLQLSKKYDQSISEKIDLSDIATPTEKKTSYLEIYLDGKQVHYGNYEYGKDIDTIISEKVTPLSNCSLGEKYIIRNGKADEKVAYESGTKLSSVGTTRIEISSTPNEGYALVVEKYVRSTSEYRNTTAYPVGDIALNPVCYNDKLVYSDKILVNDVEFSGKSISVANKQIYNIIYNLTETSNESGEVTVYINGELETNPFSRDPENENYSIIEYLNTLYYYGRFLNVIGGTGSEYLNCELYRDAEYTDKIDAFDKLGTEDFTVYVKLDVVGEDRAFVKYRDEILTSGWNDGWFVQVSAFEQTFEGCTIGYSVADIENGTISATINGVSFEESEYVRKEGGTYFVDIEPGKFYDIQVVNVY